MKGIHGMICWGMMIIAIVVACPTFCGLLPYEYSYVMFLMVPTLASYSRYEFVRSEVTSCEYNISANTRSEVMSI